MVVSAVVGMVAMEKFAFILCPMEDAVDSSVVKWVVSEVDRIVFTVVELACILCPMKDAVDSSVVKWVVSEVVGVGFTVN